MTIKRIAVDASRLAYERRRDELMQRAVAALHDGQDVAEMLEQEHRAILREQLGLRR